MTNDHVDTDYDSDAGKDDPGCVNKFIILKVFWGKRSVLARSNLTVHWRKHDIFLL